MHEDGHVFQRTSVLISSISALSTCSSVQPPQYPIPAMIAYQEAVDGQLELLQAGRYLTSIPVCEENPDEPPLAFDLLQVLRDMDDRAACPARKSEFTSTHKQGKR